MLKRTPWGLVPPHLVLSRSSLGIPKFLPKFPYFSGTDKLISVYNSWILVHSQKRRPSTAIFARSGSLVHSAFRSFIFLGVFVANFPYLLLNHSKLKNEPLCRFQFSVSRSRWNEVRQGPPAQGWYCGQPRPNGTPDLAIPGPPPEIHGCLSIL